jgi:folylpolyglutamate synthase/dihydropteroate synthase
MVAALAPALDAAVCTEVPAEALRLHGRPGARSRPAAELAALCEQAGVRAEAEPDFAAALRRARELAAEAPEAALLVTGSHYALAPARAALTAPL